MDREGVKRCRWLQIRDDAGPRSGDSPKRAIFPGCANWCADICDSSCFDPGSGCAAPAVHFPLSRRYHRLLCLWRYRQELAAARHLRPERAEISPTYIRLPGYPAFLAVVFAIFGMEHYRAALFVQMFVDLGTCFLIADLARRVFSVAPRKAAFLLAALCPFLASYVAAALTETLEVFFTTLALDFAIVGIETLDMGMLRPWLGCGASRGRGHLAAAGRRVAAGCNRLLTSASC